MSAKHHQSDASPFRLPRERSARKSTTAALVLSVMLHLPVLLAVPGLVETDDAMAPTDFNARRDFSVSVIEDSSKPAPNKADREELDGQFVNLDAPDQQERPDEARFLDQYDSRADKEMVRKQPGNPAKRPGPVAATQRPSKPKPSPTTPTHTPDQLEPAVPDKAPSDSPETSEADDAAAKASAETPQSATADPAERRAAESDAAATAAQQAAPEDADHPDDSPPRRPSDPAELFPSLNDSAIAGGGGGRIDYLKNVAEGDKTMLNRKRSRYWSFMHRLKEAVVQQWSPGEEYRRRDPSGKVYGVKDRFTNLEITLNGDGSLRTIYVTNDSGLGFYDDEAVRAVRAAAPFPNPPEGMKDRDGLIQINFGFLLDLSTGSLRNLRIFR